MKEISNVAKIVQPSPIRKMFNLADGMEDVVSFTVGEPDFNTPAHVVDAAVEALRTGKHHYTPNAGILPLREAISEYYVRSRGLHYSPETEIIATAGGMEALLLTMLTLLNPGDAFLLSDPCWTNYSRQIEICSARPVFVPVDAAHDFTFAPEALEKAITPETKGFLVNSPANPTGGIAGRKALEQLAEIAVRHDLYVISDEVYSELLYEGNTFTSIAALPGMKERTIIVNSFSKTYAMTGWRVGYALGPQHIISQMVKLQENVAACVNTAAQYGALAALTGSQAPVAEMLETYSQRRAYILDAFSKINGLTCFAPQGAFYAFVDISAAGMDAETFARDLLQKVRVIVVPGEAFGESGKRYVRLSFATSMENIREGTRRIAQYMKTLGF
jgi:aminotransferase